MSSSWWIKGTVGAVVATHSAFALPSPRPLCGRVGGHGGEGGAGGGLASSAGGRRPQLLPLSVGPLGAGASYCSRVKGGSDADAALGILDESILVSTVAYPGLGQVRAFMPEDAGAIPLDHGIRRKSLLGFTMVEMGGMHAWFYPDPPWGRKDFIRPGSRFLQVWDMVVWVAMVYVAIAVPFRAAGFTRQETDIRQAGNTCSDHRRAWWDLVVDGFFLVDILLSLHTAYYKPMGAGKFVLVDDLLSIRKHYLGSLGFVCDFLGIVPLKEIFCFVAYLIPKRRVMPPTELVGLFRILRMAKLARLHHFRHMWRFMNTRFPRKSKILALTKLVVMLLFTGVEHPPRSTNTLTKMSMRCTPLLRSR